MRQISRQENRSVISESLQEYNEDIETVHIESQIEDWYDDEPMEYENYIEPEWYNEVNDFDEHEFEMNYEWDSYDTYYPDYYDEI